MILDCYVIITTEYKDYVYLQYGYDDAWKEMYILILRS
jgi:hypothetical protein